MVSSPPYYQDWLTALCLVAIPPSARILEVGCARGDLLGALRPSRGIGIDVDPTAIAEARKRYPELEFHVADIHHFVSDETFDYIVLADVLVHLTDLQRAMDNVRSMCHEGTQVFVASHNAAWQWAVEIAERFNLKRKSGKNWLGMGDVRNLCHLTDFSILQDGTTLLVPIRLGGVSDGINEWLSPLPDRQGDGSLRQLRSPLWIIHWIQYFILKPIPIRAPQPLSVTVIVPTRNEVGNIETCVESIPDMGTGTEIIFVDGLSTDGTIQAIEAMMARYPQKRIRLLHQIESAADIAGHLQGEMAAVQRSGKMLPQGKADATRKGFAAATGDVLMILDADLTVEPRELPRFFDVLARGKADFVNGSRLLYPMEGGAMRFINLLGNKFFSAVFSWLLNQYVKDTLCGTKVLRRVDYLKVQAWYQNIGNFDPFGDFELLFGASATGMRIVDLPIHYRRRVHSIPKIENWKHAPLLFKMSWRGFLILKLGPWFQSRARRARPGYQDKEREHFDHLVDETGEIWWGSGTPAGIERLRRRARLIRQALSFQSDPAVLEIGCGTGAFSHYILDYCPDLRLTGCDLSPKAVATAHARYQTSHPRASFVEADCLALPFADGSFDAVVGNAILHHLPVEQALREAFRVLRPGGVLWFSEPNMLNPQVALERNNRTIGRWLQNSEDETAFFRWSLAVTLRRMGFVSVVVRPYDFLHPLVPAAIIGLVTQVGDLIERAPLLREFSGSLMVTAVRPRP